MANEKRRTFEENSRRERRIIGWSVSEQPDTRLVLTALAQALDTRRNVRGQFLFHSDQGCQYTSAVLQDALKEREIVASMSRRGQCWDNAPNESLFRTFKRETGIRKLRLIGLQEVEALAFDWIETWYNLRRRHTFTGYKIPAEYELKRAAETVRRSGNSSRRIEALMMVMTLCLLV